MTGMNEKQMREMFGDNIVEIINDALRNLGIPIEPTDGNIEDFKKVSLLFMIQKAIMSGHQLDMKADDVIKILEELVIINKRIFEGAKTSVKQAKSSQYN